MLEGDHEVLLAWHDCDLLYVTEVLDLLSMRGIFDIQSHTSLLKSDLNRLLVSGFEVFPLSYGFLARFYFTFSCTLRSPVEWLGLMCSC